MGAQTDFLSERTRAISTAVDRGGIWRQFLGRSLEENPETYRLASPLVHLDETDPPVRLITGEKDGPSTRAADLRQKMKEFGTPADLTVINGAPHPFTVKQVWFDEAMEKAGEFFIRHLKKPTS